MSNPAIPKFVDSSTVEELERLAEELGQTPGGLLEEAWQEQELLYPYEEFAEMHVDDGVRMKRRMLEKLAALEQERRGGAA